MEEVETLHQEKTRCYHRHIGHYGGLWWSMEVTLVTMGDYISGDNYGPMSTMEPMEGYMTM